MNKTIIAMVILLVVSFLAAPVAEEVMTWDYLTDASFQAGPQAHLVYRCQRYNLKWPCKHPSGLNFIGKLEVAHLHHINYDPKMRAWVRDLRALAKSLGHGAEVSFN